MPNKTNSKKKMNQMAHQKGCYVEGVYCLYKRSTKFKLNPQQLQRTVWTHKICQTPSHFWCTCCYSLTWFISWFVCVCVMNEWNKTNLQNKQKQTNKKHSFFFIDSSLLLPCFFSLLFFIADDDDRYNCLCSYLFMLMFDFIVILSILSSLIIIIPFDSFQLFFSSLLK